MKQKVTKSLREDVIFIAPTFLFYVFVVVIPFIFGIYYSMTDWNGISASSNWTGLDNFKNIFMHDVDFAQSFWFTSRVSVVIVVLSNLLGFALAYMLTKPLRSRNALRTLFFIPNVLGGVLLGFIWQFIFTRGFATIGELTGIGFFELSWLGTSNTSFWAIVIVKVWQEAGYVMVIYIAGLMNVPSELKEAIDIDGADSWQKLRHLTLPLIMPAITVCLFWSISVAFKMFDVNYSLTSGGPFRSTESIAMNIYFEAFQYNRFGLGTAKALIYFVAILVITSVQVYITKRKEVEA
ncbi:carbohydrate ABC transporter permease [Paenibacillus sp. S150]|uniref:carbohydrate ABC transporter permease n=1 Tax=Paenibacillus sp. S150 TaxID=2749826 RepID=UPI001C5A059C|nr:sugar ABC transporter permease [Paenibacillus sp. S150]MBW4079817.1 sugar ABC transporter permease [Paenibacillus sp. S150]